MPSDLHRTPDLRASVRVLCRHQVAHQGGGRDPDGVIVLPGIVPYIGSTEEEARSWPAFDELRSRTTACWHWPGYSSSIRATSNSIRGCLFGAGPTEAGRLAEPIRPDHRARGAGGLHRPADPLPARWRPGPLQFVGTPDQVADTILEWFGGGAADGFNIMAPALPSGLQAFIDHVLPILRRQGSSARSTKARRCASTTGSPFRRTSSAYPKRPGPYWPVSDIGHDCRRSGGHPPRSGSLTALFSRTARLLAAKPGNSRGLGGEAGLLPRSTIVPGRQRRGT